MMKKTVASVVLLGCALLLSGWRHGTGFQDGTLYTLKIGGGGYVTGIDICTDGTKRIRVDTVGGYQWNGSSWDQQYEQSRWPASAFGYYPNPGTSQVLQNGGGFYEFVGAPSQCSTAYVTIGSDSSPSSSVMRLFKTTNNGVSYSELTLPGSYPLNSAAGLPDAYRITGKKAAVDPANPNIAYFGTMVSGVLFTSDGGSNISLISTSTIPVASGSVTGGTAEGYNIAFDPSTTTTLGCPGGQPICTGTIYVFSNGNGLYVSTNAGSTWALAASGPTHVQQMVVAPSGGKMAAIGGTDASAVSGNLYTYTSGGGWVQNTASGTSNSWHIVAIDPADINHWVLVGAGGGISVTANAGTSWNSSTSGTCTGTCSRSVGDAPWLAQVSASYMTTGNAVFDPTASNTLWLAYGLGVATTSPPTTPSSTAFAWRPTVNGIEQLQAGTVIAPNGAAIVGNHDIATFYLQPSRQNATSAGSQNVAFSLVMNSQADWATTDKNFIAYNMQSNVSPPDISGYSTDGGQNILPFNSWYVIVPASNMFQCGGSGVVSTDICVTVPSTSGLTTWANGSGSIVTVNNYTLPSQSGGINSLLSYPVNVVNSTTIELRNSTYASSYAATGGNIIIYVPAQALSLHQGAGNINNAVSGTAGRIKVTWTAISGQSLSGILGDFSGSTNKLVCISGIATGTTEANGCWVTTALDQNNRTVELWGSTFSNAWTENTFAPMVLVGQSGGSIAAADTNNIVRVMGNQDFVYCTTNRGADGWTRMTFPNAYNMSAISSASWSAGTVTFMTSTPVNMVTTGGINQFVVSNANPSTYNGVYTATTGTSGSTVKAALASDPGAYVSSGFLNPSYTGWPFAWYLNTSIVAADRVTPNTFYGYNSISGFYRWTNCGTPVSINTRNAYVSTGDGAVLTGSAFNTIMRTVPGQAGHFFFTSGAQGSAGSSHPATTSLYRTCNAGAGSMTLSTVDGFFEPQSVGFGAVKPGQSYPSIYVVGWYDSGNVRASAIFGVWRSVDDGSNGSTTTCIGGTWQNILSPGATSNVYPGGWNTTIRDVNGDLTDYARVFIAGSNRYMFGRFPFLLRRDRRRMITHRCGWRRRPYGSDSPIWKR